MARLDYILVNIGFKRIGYIATTYICMLVCTIRVSIISGTSAKCTCILKVCKQDFVNRSKRLVIQASDLPKVVLSSRVCIYCHIMMFCPSGWTKNDYRDGVMNLLLNGSVRDRTDLSKALPTSATYKVQKFYNLLAIRRQSNAHTEVEIQK